MIPEYEILIRLLLAALFGIAVGFERERKGQPAGLRTHTILSVGSALAMTLSINLAFPSYDPTRLAAQVVSGIGFLGAGAILRYGTSVKGLTTATSLWTMAVVGLATGAGYYLVAACTTALLLIILVAFNIFEKKYIHQATMLTIAISAENRSGLVNDIKKIVTPYSKEITSTSFTKNVEKDSVTISLTVITTSTDQNDVLINKLSDIKGVRKISIS
jgi:putative Mg2+ transporter-C (MgtC) family protein